MKKFNKNSKLLRLSLKTNVTNIELRKTIKEE